ncbi:MAG TPA: extracellular solute-binding protein [Chloroflexota bacterium]|nr:extracellular solute-binding protein [Chloroflexota bacterium]
MTRTVKRAAAWSLGLAALTMMALGCTPARPGPAQPHDTAAAPRAATAAPLSPALQTLVDAAAAEGGRLSIVSGPFYNTDDPAAFIDEVSQGMEARYGIAFTIADTPGPSEPENATRIITELQTGRQSETDLYTGTNPDVVRLWQDGALLPVAWRDYDGSIPEAGIGPDTTSLAYETQVKTLLYNTNLVPPNAVPHSLADLLDPRWRHQIASTVYASGFDLGAIFGIGDDYLTAWMRSFAQGSLAGLIRCSEFKRVATGEFAMVAVTCSNGDVLTLMAQGAPVDYVVLSDLPVLNYSYVAVPKNSAHPNSATLLALFLTTPEGQQLLWKHHRDDLDLLDGAHFHEIVKERMLDQGIQPVRVSAEMLASKVDDLARVKAKYQKILGGQD